MSKRARSDGTWVFFNQAGKVVTKGKASYPNKLILEMSRAEGLELIRKVADKLQKLEGSMTVTVPLHGELIHNDEDT